VEWGGLLIALMMEAARTSETLVNFYQTTQHYNPEDSHLRTHRHENLMIIYINTTMYAWCYVMANYTHVNTIFPSDYHIACVK
jgi:hypothetical protein